MSDLVNDARFMKYYHTSEDSLLDKDILKNQTWEKYCSKVQLAFGIPLVFQLWQIYLINNPAKIGLY